jgi:hypothetical protein
MAGRQNRTAVFQCNTYHFAFEIGCKAQFIADSCYKHVARTHLPIFFTFAAYAFYGFILAAINVFINWLSHQLLPVIP